VRRLLPCLLVLLLAEASASGAGDNPGAAGDSAGESPTISPILPEKVETTSGSIAPAGADEGWRPFPPTTPDVPAFSIPIVEVDPPVAPAYKGVAQVSGVLSSNPQILLVEIRVHSECAGGGAAAQRASEVAAARIREFIVAQGIAEGRLSMVPMGCTRPIRSPEATAEDRAANRRIEVVVVEVSEPSP
jgi:hypothetical protein